MALSGLLLPLICLRRGLEWSDRENVREIKWKTINSAEDTPKQKNDNVLNDVVFFLFPISILWCNNCRRSSQHWEDYKTKLQMCQSIGQRSQLSNFPLDWLFKYLKKFILFLQFNKYFETNIEQNGCLKLLNMKSFIIHTQPESWLNKTDFIWSINYRFLLSS